MQKITSGTGNNIIPVSTGRYFVRICNDKIMSEYNADDIQAYSFSIVPRLKAEGIILGEYDGNEGPGSYVKYSGLDKAYFRTKNWLKVPGYVVVFDGEDAYGVEGHDVTIMYKNPYWEHNETPEFASTIVFWLKPI